MVERIEVLEGGQGLFYGTQAVAGVINIITKQLTSEPGGQVSVGVDTNSGRHFSGYVRGALGPHQFAIFGSSDTADGFRPIALEDYQPSATERKRGYDVQTLGGKYGVDVTSDIRLSASYQRTWAKLDYAAPTLISEYFNKRVEDLGSLKLDWHLNSDLALFVKGYYHRWKTNVFRSDNSLSSPGNIVPIDKGTFWGYKDYGVNVLAEFKPGGPLDFLAGYDFQNYNGHDDVLRISEQTETVHALFGQLRSSSEFSSRLHVALGARHNMPKGGGGSITIWNASARYDISDALYIQANGGTSYRLPDAEQLFAIDPCCTLGNPALTGEKSRNLNASIGYQFENAGQAGKIEIVGFLRQVTNLITGVDNGNGVEVYQNTPDKTRVKGFLFAATIPLFEGIIASGSFNYTSAKNQGQQIVGIPRSNAKAAITYASDRFPIGGSLSANYFGKTFQRLSGGLGRQSYGDVTTFDLSTFLEFGPDRRHRLTARIENLTDKVYATRLERAIIDGTSTSYVAHYVGVPRTFHLSYSYSF